MEAKGPEAVGAAARRADLSDPLRLEAGTVIDLLQEAAFVEAAAEITGDIDFGFLAGLALSIGTSLPGYISEHSRTLRDALKDAAQVLPQVRPGMDFALEELGNVATLQLRLSDPRLQEFPRHREAVFAGVIGQIRSFTARPFHPELLRFRHERVPPGREARAGLGCDVAFGVAATEMLMGLPVLDRPIRGRNDGLRALLVSHGELLEAQGRAHEASFAERVELFVQQALASEVPALDKVARELGVSRRTLSRRLAEEETSFADILAHVRLRLAAAELRATSRPVGEIGLRLGYATASAFSTAFRKASGMTPRAYRSGLTADMGIADLPETERLTGPEGPDRGPSHA
ncbi:AraC family transcriptional regulator [Mangrovicoccus ximenensis]|uniref:AraC family transcriptional regulator n=1 Tax=Mangrovicoccus ximenensis TaxID=1911570 RepID=UPI0022AAF5B7|nr:AraC family transcriptional regulator [Mangrovicoccus ximenensis]